jgi:hypothetical protein
MLICHALNINVCALPVTSALIQISGVKVSVQNNAVATGTVGELMACSCPGCVPMANTIQWINDNTSAIELTSSVELSVIGTYRYTCTVFHTVVNVPYNASRTILVSVLPVAETGLYYRPKQSK